MTDKAECRACSDREAPAAPKPVTATTPATTPATAAAPAPAAAAVAYQHSGCPLNRREVGRAAWAFLHTTAAYYPDAPTGEQRDIMRDFMYNMARVYPCGYFSCGIFFVCLCGAYPPLTCAVAPCRARYCADTTSNEMVRNPPRVGSRRELTTWLCEIHNEVNDRLGKPMFDCSKIEERWRSGPPDGSCG